MQILIWIAVLATAVIAACAVSIRMVKLAGIEELSDAHLVLKSSVANIKQEVQTISENQINLITEIPAYPSLFGKKIVYDGDSIAESRENNGGGYAQQIAELTGNTYENLAVGGGWLCYNEKKHSVVRNLVNLPSDGDLYCFEGGINDYWGNAPLGQCDPADYTGKLDTKTVCGAMETIFRYCMENFPGRPVCFVIVHKIQNTAVSKNANGDTFEDYRNAMVAVCQKYSIPYFDAFTESGLNGWNDTQNQLYLTANSKEKPDGIHPNEEGYRRYYVPQLLDLFTEIMPVE